MSEFNQVIKEGASTLGKKMMRILLVILLLAVVAGIGFVWVSNWTYSDGSRAGYLIKVSRKGVVWKTHEGQLNLGGFSTDEVEGMSGNIWSFSVRDREVYRQLEELEGQRVRLRYRQVYRAMPWQGKTKYFVYEADLVKEQK